ncbi:glycoside hydrolase family 43 protein [Terrimonas pollutisoli]|uniref:glycoside hydrolase family 43 protein n=1 Tax=Terrimonas pollutisoli TaxID=3034147 RepID=UPI0023EDF579|nr:glycoside hydrolase 43 family protein [Terrimonas sp. H1YJ31]
MKKFVAYTILCGLISFNAFAQNNISRVWVSDNGNRSYKNPVINADYSDPDAIRVGDDYYMISSSFNHIPGLPILHSKDLVNWTIIGHALKRQAPFDHFTKVQHGNGVWAPAIRYHKNEFYIYYPDPDFGIYLIKAKNIKGPWSDPVLVEGGKGLIDPCPLWDEDGKVYLVHAYAGSRAGIKSIIVIKQMNTEGTKTIDDGVMVYDGHDLDPTLEGPKVYKRNGWYYLFAPAGGVSTGWQLVLRSKNIYGPYERKVVMDQGSTTVNGPHQGAWVDTKTGEHWFLHFQDKEAYGRVVHLQPMKWVNDWPVIGEDKDGDGKGQPVMIYKKPNVGKTYPITTPADSDEFDKNKSDSYRIGLQWQWQANAKPYWAFPSNGQLRLFSYPIADSVRNYWEVPNLLMQKFPADEFSVTTKISFKPRLDGEKAGLIILGADYAYVAVEKRKDGHYISYSICKEADKGKNETVQDGQRISNTDIYFRVIVGKGGMCEFSYSEDGKTFEAIGDKLTAKSGRWVGAKVGLFCTRTAKTNDSGFMDVDWFRVENPRPPLNLPQ